MLKTKGKNTDVLANVKNNQPDQILITNDLLTIDLMASFTRRKCNGKHWLVIVNTVAPKNP